MLQGSVRCGDERWSPPRWRLAARWPRRSAGGDGGVDAWRGSKRRLSVCDERDSTPPQYVSCQDRNGYISLMDQLQFVHPVGSIVSSFVRSGTSAHGHYVNALRRQMAA